MENLYQFIVSEFFVLAFTLLGFYAWAKNKKAYALLFCLPLSLLGAWGGISSLTPPILMPYIWLIVNLSLSCLLAFLITWQFELKKSL